MRSVADRDVLYRGVYSDDVVFLLLEDLMAVTSIDLDQAMLDTAKALTGARTNRDVVNRALQTLIAVRSQPAAVERMLSREFTDEQTHAPVIRYASPGVPSDAS
jgi:Arc/MetJ family transcription regulator